MGRAELQSAGPGGEGQAGKEKKSLPFRVGRRSLYRDREKAEAGTGTGN